MPDPYKIEIRNLLEYVPLRIIPEDPDIVIELANLARSNEIQDELWAVTEEVAIELDRSDIIALYVESVNDVITVSAQRVTAGIYARVPDTILVFSHPARVRVDRDGWIRRGAGREAESSSPPRS